MGFGGGGGVSITGAHIHDNNAGQGGNLTDATLIKMGTDTPYELHKIMPVGTMVLWGGTRATIPDRFIPCDGASLLRAGTFAELFDIIGVQFGTVDGTHFNAPDMDDKFGRGSDNGSDSGATGGADAVTLSTAEMPSHAHSGTAPSATGGSGGGALFSGSVTGGAGLTINATGGGGSHENKPAFVEGIYIIRF